MAFTASILLQAVVRLSSKVNMTGADMSAALNLSFCQDVSEHTSMAVLSFWGGQEQARLPL